MHTFAQKPKATELATSSKSTIPRRAHFRQSRKVNSILHLQRTIGNQAVLRLLEANPEVLEVESDTTASTRFAHDFSRIPIFKPSPIQIQPKLTVNTPGDVYEQEANRVADQVMRMPDSQLQGDCACGGGCPKCRNVQDVQEQMPVKHNQDHHDSEVAAAPMVQEAKYSSGQPLDAANKAYFEPRFGHDFSKVRVHMNANAAEHTRAVNARAFTVGKDIVFGVGEYRADTSEGRRLLAHELAHVCQQNRVASAPLIQRYEGPEHQDIGDRYLRELPAFLQTEEGTRWARELGFNRDDLVAQILRDPMQRGAKIRLAPRVNPETGAVENVDLTPGEIIALMGDFYATVKQLANAPARELRSILDVMQGERVGTVPDAAERFEKITGGRYLALAQRNDTHFARLNRAEWRRLHEEAIAVAQAAGREQSEEQFQRALLIDAAAGHFLTDAYAAGHLFDKSEVLAGIWLHLSSNSALTRNPEMQTYVGLVAFKGRLPQLVLKNLHDRMNREGFKVGNARGMRWRTFGDNYLEVADETQRVAALAVFLSRQQVFAARNGESANPDEIEGLMPDEDSVQRATQQAIVYIPDAVAEVETLIYRNRSLAPSQLGTVLGAIVESNLATIGHPGREREIVEMVESARRRGQEVPIVAPSFTVFSWQ